jgi:hypothetical protein
MVAEIDLESLIKTHTKQPALRFSNLPKIPSLGAVQPFLKKFAFSMLLIVLLSVGVLASMAMTFKSVQAMTGFVVAAAEPTAEDAYQGWTAIRKSPDLTKIKLFFYSLWTIAVLVATATVHERTRERIV